MRVQPMLLRAIICAAIYAAAAHAATVSPLAAAGYSVLPAPQRVTLKGAEFQFAPTWRLQLDEGVKETSVATEALKEGLAARHGIRLAEKDGPAITLSIRANSVAIESAQDREKDVLANDAYRIELSDKAIH